MIYYFNKKIMKKTIFSNYPNEEKEKVAKESILSNNEERDFTEEPITEEEICDEVYFLEGIEREDARTELDIQLSNSILAIADLGLWNGQVKGYTIIDSGNIKDCLYSDCDYCEWYIERGNLKSRQSHHDGTNIIEYRMIKDNVDIDILLDRIYNNERISRQLLNYYTESIGKEILK